MYEDWRPPPPIWEILDESHETELQTEKTDT